MSVLLFGGTGLIGLHAARALAARGASVTIASRKPPSNGSLAESGVQWLACDVRRVDDVEHAFRVARPHKVLHLAAALQFACDDDPSLAVSVNVDGTHHVLAAARAAGVERVVFGSSVAAYGARSDLMREEDPPAPSSVSLYGAAKWFDERLGIQYAIRHDLRFIALRYCAVFGNGGSASRGMARVRELIAESRAGREIAIPDASGEERAQLTFVSDAVDVTLRALEISSPRHFVYNVAGPPENYISLTEYSAHVARLFPRAGPIAFSGRARSLGPVDTTRIRDDLGCTPRITVQEGLRTMFAEEIGQEQSAKA